MSSFTVTIQKDQRHAVDSEGNTYVINSLVIQKESGNVAIYKFDTMFYKACLAPNTIAKALLITPGRINVY